MGDFVVTFRNYKKGDSTLRNTAEISKADGYASACCVEGGNKNEQSFGGLHQLTDFLGGEPIPGVSPQAFFSPPPRICGCFYQLDLVVELLSF